jgi:hypothetical protein
LTRTQLLEEQVTLLEARLEELERPDESSSLALHNPYSGVGAASSSSSPTGDTHCTSSHISQPSIADCGLAAPASAFPSANQTSKSVTSEVNKPLPTAYYVRLTIVLRNYRQLSVKHCRSCALTYEPPFLSLFAAYTTSLTTFPSLDFFCILTDLVMH